MKCGVISADRPSVHCSYQGAHRGIVSALVIAAPAGYGNYWRAPIRVNNVDSLPPPPPHRENVTRYGSNALTQSIQSFGESQIHISYTLLFSEHWKKGYSPCPSIPLPKHNSVCICVSICYGDTVSVSVTAPMTLYLCRCQLR